MLIRDEDDNSPRPSIKLKSPKPAITLDIQLPSPSKLTYETFKQMLE
jgi:hypothetical protein